MPTTKEKKKKKKKIPRVGCVGFASFNPQVIVVFTAYSSNPNDRVYYYRSANRDEWDVPDPEHEDGKSYVILTEPEKITDLRPHTKKIHRLLVFGTPGQLQELGIPIVDVKVDETGKVAQIEECTIKEIQGRIEEDAVTIKLRKDGVKKKKKKSKKKEVAEADASQSEDPENEKRLLEYLKDLDKEFSGSKVDFENIVMIPMLLRFCREEKRKAFKNSCLEMTEYGIDEETASNFIEFVEARVNTLGKAARKILWPKNPEKVPSSKKVGTKYGVDPRDVKLIVHGVRRLSDELTR
jgi:hypothetical protein